MKQTDVTLTENLKPISTKICMILKFEIWLITIEFFETKLISGLLVCYNILINLCLTASILWLTVRFSGLKIIIMIIGCFRTVWEPLMGPLSLKKLRDRLTTYYGVTSLVVLAIILYYESFIFLILLYCVEASKSNEITICHLDMSSHSGCRRRHVFLYIVLKQTLPFNYISNTTSTNVSLDKLQKLTLLVCCA